MDHALGGARSAGECSLKYREVEQVEAPHTLEAAYELWEMLGFEALE